VQLPGHRLTFDNASTKDRSGKCDAMITGKATDLVFAVLYRINPQDKPTLDRYEGLGVEYRDAFVRIATPEGEPAEALIYYATNLDPSLKPYHWYKQHVLQGAEENGLPADYIAAIRAVESIADCDRQREERELNIYSGSSPGSTSS
jgi:gamma-glutamylcyclotransferase (GGCT)/AIG2-like uncharacterized protein YtfP